MSKPPKKNRSSIIPKGLRSFDATDADFFLQLLPGPYDRHGFPEGVRFWVNRISSNSAADGAFRVGMIYGPSGSGKSSLIRAGAVPSLRGSIDCIIVECKFINIS